MDAWNTANWVGEEKTMLGKDYSALPSLPDGLSRVSCESQRLLHTLQLEDLAEG